MLSCQEYQGNIWIIKVIIKNKSNNKKQHINNKVKAKFTFSYQMPDTTSTCF